MILVASRYQLLDAARPTGPQRARDLQTAQTVWLREARLPDGDDGAAAVDRAHAAKGIFHPSLVTLFDVMSLPGNRLLLAYEFVPAQPVALASAGQPFNPRRTAVIVSEIADAVAELHARDVRHGGISTSTVLLTMKGKAKLDRLADPSLHSLRDPDEARDLSDLAELLSTLAGRQVAGGVVGAQALEAVLSRARRGLFESAATLASMLRRVGEDRP